jgi:hypothetical protein
MGVRFGQDQAWKKGLRYTVSSIIFQRRARRSTDRGPGQGGGWNILIMPTSPGQGIYWQSLCKLLGAGGPATQGTALRYA